LCVANAAAAAVVSLQQEQPQEDAQEFIQHVLSKLHEELAEVRV
jgi:ubiquitin C-terminal hydrolase